MRHLRLYLRERHVPAGLGTAVSGVVVLWTAGQLVDDARLWRSVGVLVAAVVVVVLGPGLAGSDHDLDQTAAISWAWVRGLHMVTGVVLLSVLVAGTTLVGDPTVTVPLLVRDVAGLAGLLGVGAVLFGAGRAWLLPMAGAGPAVMLGPLTGDWPRELLTWAAQPAEAGWATVTAVLLGTVGLLGYALFGARRGPS